MTTSTRLDRAIDEALALGDERVAELQLRREPTATRVAAELARMVRALRLAVVADVEASLKSRLHLRLGTALRRADYVLDERDQLPPSQRPTWPPAQTEPDPEPMPESSEPEPPTRVFSRVSAATPTSGIQYPRLAFSSRHERHPARIVRHSSEIVVKGTVHARPAPEIEEEISRLSSSG